MSNRVRTPDALAAFREIVEENAGPAGTLTSRDDAKKLHPYVKRAQEAIRSDGGKGARVRTGDMIERSVATASETWDKFSPIGRSRAFLSEKEIAAIRRADPELGELTQAAHLRVRGRAAGDPVADIRGFFDRFDFTNRGLGERLPDAVRIDARPGRPEREDLPPSLLAAFDFYYRAEERDWATVLLQRAQVSGHEVYLVSMTTDGDSGYLEVFTPDGQPLTSARLFNEAIFGWDEFFGRTRLDPNLTGLALPEVVEGLSEPDEIAAAGQIPRDWPPDVVVERGAIRHLNGYFDTITLPANTALTPDQREVMYGAFELLWDRTLRHRIESGDGALQLGVNGEGILRIGRFDRPDGRALLVADWKDIDDASFTFYFERDRNGQLQLAIEQRGVQPDRALQHSAHMAGMKAVRAMVVNGGVNGSQSGNTYVTYYREGWNGANVRPTKPRANPTSKPNRPAPGYELRADPNLEGRIRAMLIKAGPDGREVVRKLDAMGTKILFRQKGGTTNNASENAIYIETHKSRTGDEKPLTWLVASVAHEVEHAWDDHHGRTPPTKSPRFAEYRAARQRGTVTMQLRKEMLEERLAYVNGQVDGEARAMSTEARILRTLEEQGEDLQDLNRTVLDTYDQAVNQAVVHGVQTTLKPATAAAP